MSLSILILIDVVAILILTFGIYWPRHRRKDMVVAYLTANIGVAAVAYAAALVFVPGLAPGLDPGAIMTMNDMGM